MTCPTACGRRASCSASPTRSRKSTLPSSVPGARVAITASYQASVEGFVAAGLDAAAALEAIAAQRQARAARARRFIAEEAAAGRDPGGLLVAGSVGPYGAMLADGSEYRGDYDPGDAALRAFHRAADRCARRGRRRPARGRDDPDLREARVLVRLLDETGVPAWISYTVPDGHDRRRRAVRRGGRPRRDPPATRLLWASTAPPRNICARCSRSREPRPTSARRLPEPRRHLGCGSTHLAERQGRVVGPRRRGVLDGPWGRVARRLLRHPTGGYRAAGDRPWADRSCVPYRVRGNPRSTFDVPGSGQR